jgi:hypothetical protein
MPRLRGFYPLLLAFYPVLHLYDVNAAELRPSVILAPLLKILAATLASWLLLGLALKDRLKAGLVVSWLLVLFFSYGHAYHWVHSGWDLRHRHLLALWALLGVLGVAAILRLRGPLMRLHRGLDVATTLLTAIVLGSIGLGQMKLAAEASRDAGPPPPTRAASTDSTGTLPDIYYIILDSYAGESVLRDLYGFDNRAFLARLKARGFYVADSSHSNYWATLPSMSSSLNMSHLSELVDPTLPRSEAIAQYQRLIRHNRVAAELGRLGYSQIFINPPWEMFLGDFQYMLWRTTALSYWQRRQYGRQQTLSLFDRIAAVPGTPGPHFLYAHIICPHAPYVFGPNGEPVAKMEGALSENPEELKRRYLDQLQFVSRKADTLVDAILSRSRVPPMIILQADHGPTNEGNLSRPNPRLIRERFSILNAYYVPDRVRVHLYPSISPVNAFRVILQHQFGMTYPLVPDESYLARLGTKVKTLRRVAPEEL